MTITVMNKGGRTWLPVNVRGLPTTLEPHGLAEMEELDALRFMQAYPREIIPATAAMPSSGEIQRQEQSIRDRKASLDKREKELDEREKQVSAREKELDGMEGAEPEPGNTDAAPGPAPEAPKRGRPAQVKK